MNEPEEIIRVAAKGDGITLSGRHISRAAPGDTVLPDGSIQPGPHHVEPPCPHFGKCGGCQLQHLDAASLADFVRDRVVNAAEGQGLSAEVIAPVHLSPPHSRRRASLMAVNGGGKPLIGFRESGSHKVVGIRQCDVLRPELFSLLNPLRSLIATQGKRYAVEIELSATDQGVDCALKNFSMDGLEATEAALDFAREYGLARLSVDMGYGSEAVWEPEPVTVTLGSVPVAFPSGAFLQATQDGEQALSGAVSDWLSERNLIADLFSGLGTFSFEVGKPVAAYEAARDAHLACRVAAGKAQLPVEAFHRDLFRNPVRSDELARFDGIILDPPRAGARDQVAQIAASPCDRVVYISCNPASWAKDARMLADAGFHLAELRPVGQFRWSTHVELASLFVR
ncbi:MAG: class I SAM-dependent RNA methyltransferase [Tsuneonella suprasediminis]|nr:class I SAM-dependent RNA methyltransferase [Altererythrobacter sp. N1]